MRLLFVTRKADKHDGVAGFSYYWINEFALQLEKLYVICLEKGNCNGLPSNCVIHSLGKELGKNRLREFMRFQAYARKFVPIVDGVLTHQNPEYGILIAPWCKLFRKKLISWYAHGTLNWKTTLLHALADSIITSSEQGFRKKSSKRIILHQGIDTDVFCLGPRELPRNKILSVSRLSPSKHIELMLDLIERLLPLNLHSLHLSIVGDSITTRDRIYVNELKQNVISRSLTNFVTFHGAMPLHKLIQFYHNASLFVNFSETGSLDKAVLEAMSCGVPVLVTNDAYRTMLLGLDDHFFSDSSITSLIQKAQYLLNRSVPYSLRQRERQIVETNHGLTALVRSIISLYRPQ